MNPRTRGRRQETWLSMAAFAMWSLPWPCTQTPAVVLATCKCNVSPSICAGRRQTREVHGRAIRGMRYLGACGGTGVGEVIKGWDKGVEGMRVGDKRKITVRRTPATCNGRSSQC